jgi:hypothetical protein
MLFRGYRGLPAALADIVKSDRRIEARLGTHHPLESLFLLIRAPDHDAATNRVSDLGERVWVPRCRVF